MKISFASPTTLDTPEHVALAEELGYGRAWLYDTPQQSPDVWMTRHELEKFMAVAQPAVAA